MKALLFTSTLLVILLSIVGITNQNVHTNTGIIKTMTPDQWNQLTGSGGLQVLGGNGLTNITNALPSTSRDLNNAAGYSQDGGQVLGVSTSTPSQNISVDPNAISQYNQAIGNTQSAVDRLGGQQQSGLSAIDASYQNALNSLLLGRNQSQQAYDTSKTQSGLDYVGAKNTIGSQAGSLLNSVQRLLGSRGAGGGSAYLQGAPQAVGRNATIQRGDVTNTFGQNQQALDTNWGNYLQGYDNSLNSAKGQKDQATQTLQQSIDTNRANLLQTLAQLTGQRDQAAGGSPTAGAQPFLDQANALLDKTANYTTAPISVNTNAYQAPSLASYTNPPPTTINSQNQGSNDYFSPYLSALLGKRLQTA